MKPLFDFGLSQEDPLTEQTLLDIQPHDKVLSVASGGEVPLTLLCLNENIHITAVDLMPSQILLCRLKLLTALYVDFPLSGRFLGYAPMKRSERRELFTHMIKPHLAEEEGVYWQQNLPYIERGIVGLGRFERYIGKMRLIARLFIGDRNLKSLIACKTAIEQQSVFSNQIATRKSLRWLFRMAFHPRLYKNRGLQEQALIHARTDTGQRFYRRFELFCTGTPSSTNYFLHYFLTGKCHTPESYPEYLQPRYKDRLLANYRNLEFKHFSFQDALREKNIGYFNKIHFSNLGDWMDSAEFNETIQLLTTRCLPGTKIVYRYLQKDHLFNNDFRGITVDRSVADAARNHDRFPFYTTYLLVESSH